MAEVVALQQTDKGEMVPEVLASFEKPRIPWHNRLEERFGVSRASWKVLVEAIWPSAKTADSVMLALQYCRDRGLDPLKRPVHIVPMWSTAENKMVETVWPGISELRTTAARTNAYAGCDDTAFGPFDTKSFTGQVDVWEKGRKTGTKEITAEVTFPEWAQVTLYRMVGGQRCKFVGPKVYWLESYASVGRTDVPNDMWRDRAVGQLDKCAEAAALRKAFPEVGNDPTAEEMVGRTTDTPPARPADPPLSLGPPPAPPVAIEELKQPAAPEPVAATEPAAREPAAGTGHPAADKPPPTNEELEIPGFLRRDHPARDPEPAPAAILDDDDILEAEQVETATDVLRELEDHLATAKNVEEVEQFYSEGDFEARLEGLGGVDHAREAKDKHLKRLEPKPDPFIVPNEFRNATHYISWVDGMIEATKSPEDAERLRAGWNDKAVSKPARAKFLSSDLLEPLKIRVIGAITNASDPKAAAVTVDPSAKVTSTEGYFAQCRAVLAWTDARKIEIWMKETAEVRAALGISADDPTWKKAKSTLVDRRNALGEP